MATTGNGTLNAWNGSYTITLSFSWSRDANGVVSWSVDIPTIDGTNSPCWTNFFIRGGKNAQDNLTGDLTSYCATCSQCASYYQGHILWAQTQSGTINMGSGGGTLKLGFFGTRNGSNTEENYLTWDVDPTYTPPTGISVTDISPTKDSVTATVSVGSWGIGTGTKYRGLEVWTLGRVTPYKQQLAYGDVSSGSITVDNNSSGSLAIKPNTNYTLGALANNGQAITRITSSDICTLPEEPMVDLMTTSTRSIVLGYGLNDQGGANTIYIDYKMSDETNWTTAVTITSSGAQSGTITIDNLTPNETYTINVRARSSAGWSATLGDIAATTRDVTSKIYCPVNGVAKRVTKIYFPWKRLVSVGFVPNQWIIGLNPILFVQRANNNSQVKNCIGEGGKVTMLQIKSLGSTSNPQWQLIIRCEPVSGPAILCVAETASSMIQAQNMLTAWGISTQQGMVPIQGSSFQTNLVNVQYLRFLIF